MTARLADLSEASQTAARYRAGVCGSTIDPPSLGLDVDAQPVRKFARQRLKHTYRGFSASHKIASPSMAICESTLERDQHTLLSADPEVTRFAVQPHWLSFWTVDQDGAWVRRRYAPDIIAEMRDGRRVVIEVKSAAFANTEKWRDRAKAIQSAYAEHGIGFVVFTEADIRNQPRLDNSREMLRHRGFGRDHQTSLFVRWAMATVKPPATIADILAEVVRLGGEIDAAYSVVLQFALSGEVAVDLSAPLGDSSQVFWHE